jgi:hypothetical protein
MNTVQGDSSVEVSIVKILHLMGLKNLLKQRVGQIAIIRQFDQWNFTYLTSLRPLVLIPTVMDEKDRLTSFARVCPSILKARRPAGPIAPSYFLSDTI